MNDSSTQEVQIGPWLGQVFNHFSAHWQKYLMPALAVGGTLFVLSMLMVMGMVGGAIVSDVVGEELVMFIALGGTGLLVFLVGIVVMPMFLVGFIRGILAVNRGESFVVGDLTKVLPEVPTILGIMALNAIAVWIGSMLCFIPGIILGVGLQFALTIYADKRLGVVESLQASWDLAKPHLLLLFVYFLVGGLIVGVVSYIPLIGVFIALPLNLMLNAAAYLGLTGQGELRA